MIQRPLNWFRHALRPLATLGLFMALLISTQAELPLIRLNSVFPPGGRAGATAEVTVTGADLDDADKLVFTHPGITAKPKPGAVNVFAVTIAANVPPGVYEARVGGRFGLSNPRLFAVGLLPESNLTSPGHQRANASEVALDSTINGRSEANNADYFRFNAKRGQRVLADCAGRELDSRIDDILTATDSAGHELARQRNGGELDFTAPADGVYYVELHDRQYRGGEEYPYRLTISTAAHVDFLLPPVGIPGTRSKFTVYGRNLPNGVPVKDQTIEGQPLEKLEVEIDLPGDPAARTRLDTGTRLGPSGAVLDGFEYRLPTPRGPANPVFISFTSSPVVTEKEPNNRTNEAQIVTVPCEIGGQFWPAGDNDIYQFEAKKGEVYWIEVFSQRLGLATDPFALVQRVVKNAQGVEQVSDIRELYDDDANLGGTDFNTTSRDPSWRFEVPDNGTYRVQVRDLFGELQSSPDHVYRLAIRKEQPDFRLVAEPVAPPPVPKDTRPATVWTPLLRRGETIPLRVVVFRRDGFAGDIFVTAEDLPPGVTCSGIRIEAGKNSTNLFLTATGTAARWSGTIRVVGKGKAGDTELVREARGGTLVWNIPDFNNEPVPSRLSRNVVLAVSDQETAAVTVTTKPEAIDGKAGTTLAVPLTIARHGDFTEVLKLKATGLKLLDDLPELDVDAKATNATLNIDLAKYKLPAGEHTFYLLAQTKGKYRNNPEAAQAATEALKAAEKTFNERTAESKKAVDALAAATKAVTDAEAQLKTAAEKDKAALAAKSKTATDAKAAAEKAATEAAARAKAAEADKQAAAQRSKEAEEKAKPKETTVTIYSTPIRVLVKAEEKK